MMADMAESDDSGKRVLKAELLTEIAGERSARFDNKGDRFYDLISALHKSVRGSAPDAALLVCADHHRRRRSAVRCPPLRRLPRKMSATPTRGDAGRYFGVGLLYPRRAGGRRTGDCRAIVYLACAPKATRCTPPSKRRWPTRGPPDYDVPVHLRNAPTKLMKEMGYGEYRYAHDEPNAYAAGEQYFPQEMAQTRYYHPTNRGLEGKIEKLAAR